MKLTKILLEYPGAFTPRPEDEWEKNREEIKKRKEDLEKRLDPNVRLQNYIDNGNQGSLELIHDPEDPSIWGDEEEEDDEMYYYSKLTSLPDNFTVNGDLTIYYAYNLEQLPRNLVVKGDLFMSNSGVKELPADLKVAGDIMAHSSKLERIADNFTINGELDVKLCSNIRRLPNGLTAKELSINNTSIEDVPFNLKVGVLAVGGTPLAEKYTNAQIEQIIIERGGFIKKVVSHKEFSLKSN